VSRIKLHPCNKPCTEYSELDEIYARGRCLTAAGAGCAEKSYMLRKVRRGY